jgi:NAD(P)-dependent dehydrogenase (short-subunit alcohol dehydrogenase family)
VACDHPPPRNDLEGNVRADKLFDLSGHVALVTGAASGLGRSIAEVLCANGAHVIMTDIDGDRLTASGAALRSAGGNVEALCFDIAAAREVDRAFDTIMKKHGRLDAVFANAGISGGPGFGLPDGEIDAASLELWDKCLAINLTGAFNTIRAAARHMKLQRRGSIVVTASVAALRAFSAPSYGYHAAKAGIAQVVRVAARELGPFNVRINAIAPGAFITDIAQGRMRTPEGAAMFTQGVPLGRMAEAEEIKGLALLLASPASNYMTGAIIPIDGGTQA